MQIYFPHMYFLQDDTVQVRFFFLGWHLDQFHVQNNLKPMPRLFVGRIGNKFPDQLKENFYAGGAPGITRYGGLEVGDYVFSIFDGEIHKLWKVSHFSDQPHSINPGGSVHFTVIREYKEPVKLWTEFVRCRYFEADIVILNRSIKMFPVAFWQLNVTADCPSDPAAINLLDSRNYYVYLEDGRPDLTKYNDRDIRVIIEGGSEGNISAIQEYNNGRFEVYQTLQKLYEEKNKPNERYTLKELLEFAKQDSAVKKERYLQAVMKQLHDKGIFPVPAPIALYDCILVGRKRSGSLALEEDGDANVSINTAVTEDVDAFSETDDYSSLASLLDFSPNLILFGPPGTGKTYSAQRMIEYIESKRERKKISFKELQNSERVQFITFHQSYSYEEFVEGLRPQLANDETDDRPEQQLTYVVKDGVLKRMANKAALSQLKREYEKDEQALTNVSDDNRIWKFSLGLRGKEDHIFKESIKNNTIGINWLTGKDLSAMSDPEILEGLRKEGSDYSDNPLMSLDNIRTFLTGMQKGDVVLIFNDVTSIRAIGVIEGDYYFDKAVQFPHKRKVKWLKIFQQPANILKYNNNIRLTLKTIYELKRFEFADIRELLQIGQARESMRHDALPYYLIIDEINRGNISKIFGELITLLEADKRDLLKVNLPYSRKDFVLPSSLFIIGTMNTADRSIAVLDTALRRRFVFKEIEPDTSVIRNSDFPSVNGVDLADLLERINRKLLQYHDRDHRIGHSYFLELASVNDLRIAWYYQIIPLLMEYFYNDVNTVKAIVTNHFVSDNGTIRWISDEQEFLNGLAHV
jgi:5-methylcytosine-specific restriction enzyme B